VVEGTVVALGGHRLGELDRPSTQDAVAEKARSVAKALSPLLASKTGLLLVHGNGPQAGIELLRGEMARARLPPFRLDVLVAETQGSMGYFLAGALRQEIRSRGLELDVVAVLTSVEVVAEDAPLKPIGPLLTEAEVFTFERGRGWKVARDEHGFRRVVPSPRPTRVLESESIRLLLEAGKLVIAGGGGGIALSGDAAGELRGLEAVIDKDRTATLLSIELGMKRIVHLTSVDAVYEDYGTPRAKPIARMSVREARRRLRERLFPEGSMRPKIEASVEFLEAGGKSVLITSPERLEETLGGRAGTWIAP
jgi:carbamate kinase